jgi:import receptor subunit TOM20
VEEGKEMSVEEKDADEQPKDESKVEASVKHLQEKARQEEDVE